MRGEPNEKIEKFRNSGIIGGPRGTNCGLFRVEVRGVFLTVIASDGMGWEHVSVSRPDRCPTWAEMCAIKHLFWHDDEVVMQLHPAKQDYISCHRFCLHLWRPVNKSIPLPPTILIAPKSMADANLT